MGKRIKKTIFLLLIFSYGILNSAAYYFETPRSFSMSEKNCYYPQALSSEQNSESAVFWEEADEKKSELSLYVRKSKDGYTWTEKKLIADGIAFYESPHLFYSCTSSKKKQLCAILKNAHEIEIFSSEDSFDTERVSVIKDTAASLAAPRLYTLSNGNFILFASSSAAANSSAGFIIRYSVSKDGIKWTTLKELTAASSIPETGNPIVPVLASSKKSDLLVFMVQYHRENLISLQLYACTSRDGASSWSQPVLITGSSSFESEREDFYNFSNQAPSLIYNGSSFILAWERSASGYTNSDIYTMHLSESGTVIPSTSEKLSNTGFCSKPVVFNFNGTANAVWFTNQSESKKIFLSQRYGNLWSEPEIISESNSTAAYPVISDAGKKLAFIWEKYYLKSKSHSIEILTWDNSVNPPMLKAADFDEGKRSRKNTVSFKITHASDSSGIKGCSWIITQDSSEEPPAVINADPSATNITAELNRDGLWYIKVRECDYAGNWSSSSLLTYTLDTLPPGAVRIVPPEETEEGLLPSNTFSIHWDSPGDEDIAGYIWTVKKIDDVPVLLVDNKFHPSKAAAEQKKQMVSSLLDKNETLIEEKINLSGKINSTKNSADISNLRNGLYVFAVTAVDTSGNISQDSDQVYFVLNKYNPFTAITELKTSTDEFGDTKIEISGTGFTYDGTIKEIYIDEDGHYPYDYTLKLDRNDYKVLSNYKITGIELSNIKSGIYQIGLFHTDRGLYFSNDKTVFIEENGTIKNRIAHVFKPLWKAASRLNEEGINIVKLLVAGLLVLAAVWFAVCLTGLITSLKESIKIKKEVHALIEGDIMPEEKKSKAILFSHKGKSLKSKLILNTTLLIAIMDILIFITIGVYIIRSQKRILSQSLSQRVNVMLDSLSRGAKIYLPLARKDDQLSISDLSDITNQVNALNEARYATITGFMTDENGGNLNTIWATNDENINSKIDGSEFENGTSRLAIPELNEVFSELLNINDEVTKESGDINNQIRELLTESYSLAGKIDAKSSWRRSEIQAQKNQLLLKLNTILDRISEKHSGSYPVFDSEKINEKNTIYVFYRPILYRQDNDNNFVHGTILIEVSTEELLKTIQSQISIIFQTGLLLLVIALILAFISTYILASRITRPIIKLSSHVAMIRDTADKTLLSGKTIKINTKDEIGILGDTVNEMTEGLAEAAVQSKNLTLGKDIQTKFIPLQTNETGATLSTGKLHADGAEFFSFYSGADDLSGDYFDYKKLDEHHYAIIKCDVSGHGVPAALIMVEVATLFLNYFQKWDMKNPRQGTNLSPVVGQINDLLESRGFKGRFAAFTLCIMNTTTGECWFCNAGDNLIHIYDNAAKRKKTVSLQETPAAGMFSTELIEMKGGYQVTKVTLNKGDVLFLYTDGIEEAKRNFRNENGEIINSESSRQYSEGTNEELSAERVSQIIEAVYAKSRYTLIKHNTEKNEELHFDFSTCTGTAEDAIMALVSVEKTFRMYRKKNSKPTDHVKTDKNIDSFLREHFNEYTSYCSAVQEIDNDSTCILYKGVLEDAQYDDLTLIGIRKL